MARKNFGKPGSGGARMRTAFRTIFILQNCGDWITPKDFNYKFKLGVHRRTTRRSMECLVDLGMLEKRKAKHKTTGKRSTKSPWEFKRTGRQLEPKKCDFCGRRFFDLTFHEYQTNCSKVNR